MPYDHIIFFYSAVFCDENNIPPFNNGTQEGTIDWRERKEEDPERWNAYEKRVTYTCPIGFVIDRPDRHNEQQDPIPTEAETFEVLNSQLYRGEYLAGGVRCRCSLDPSTHPPWAALHAVLHT
jgi:hypothetical protein